jgi:hypothetical protein
MLLIVFGAWLVLAALAALLVYCCSVVSNGARREHTDDDLGPEAAPVRTLPPRTHGRRLSDSWSM